jgi:hypothetical protein
MQVAILVMWWCSATPPKGLIDEVHDLTFAFVFHASAKGGTLHK